MSCAWSIIVLLAGCWGEPDKRSVIANQTRRAAEVDVQTHVTGDQPASAAPTAPSAMDAEQAAALAALGYIDEGELAVEGRPQGTAELDAERSAGGINVYTMGGRSGAVAVDMTGAEVHRWDFAIPDAWPGFSHPEVEPDSVPWRRAQVLPGGDLIGLWSGYGIVRITASSELVWGHWLPVHHDLHVNDDGSLVVLTTKFTDRPDLYPSPVAEEHLTWMSAEGHPTRSVSLLQAFERYPQWPAIWENRPVKDSEDIFHANTVYVLESDYSHIHPAFTTGRVLTSMRHLDAIALIDPETETVVWARQGGFKRQHDPQLDDDGLWIFDNQGAGGKTSRMIKIDPRNGTILREWKGDEGHRLWSRTCGHAQQLSNDNLLVVSSEQGVVYELTGDDEVVWSYHVPDEIAAEDGQRVARFFEFQRIEPTADLSWLRGAATP
jgi:hypothetical protein